MLLGTLPCFFFIIPCVFAGFATTEKKYLDLLGQFGVFLLAMLFIAKRYPNSYLALRYTVRFWFWEAFNNAQKILAVLDGLGPGDSGDFFAWDGSKIPW